MDLQQVPLMGLERASSLRMDLQRVPLLGLERRLGGLDPLLVVESALGGRTVYRTRGREPSASEIRGTGPTLQIREKESTRGRGPLAVWC